MSVSVSALALICICMNRRDLPAGLRASTGLEHFRLGFPNFLRFDDLGLQGLRKKG